MKKVLIGIVAIIVSASVLSSCSGSEESASSESKRNYPIKLINNIVINPATAGVRVSVTNDGTKPVIPTCNIRLQDASGTYKGFDQFEPLEPILPNQSKQFVVQLTITKEGAYYANNFSGECYAYTTDTKSNAGTEVVVSDIEDASWGDEQWELDENKEWPEDAWLGYGPSFKVNQPTGTQMDCTFTAFDKNGNVVGTHTYRGNTLNNGHVIPYGQNTQWYIEDTEKVVKSVETYEVSCKL